MEISTILWCVAGAFLLAQISTFATTIYLHRGMTHTALKLHPAVEFLMHLELLLATGIVPREWAAVHRKHHKFSDQEGDPHSPYIEGLWNVLFLNVLMYRNEIRKQETIDTFTPNWQGDILDRVPKPGLVGPGTGIVLASLICGLFLGVNFWLGALLGVMSWFLNAGFYIFLNAMINSVCHAVGYRNFDGQKATNLQWVALITGGEGLHNNHHQFPMSARMKARASEIDPAWFVIKALNKLGLCEYREHALARVDDNKPPRPAQFSAAA